MGYLKKHSVLFSVFCSFLLLLLVSSCGWNQSGTDQNVETFARLYGYVKYFYPSDEASRIDWERFAVYGVKQVEKIKDAGELKKKLEELFLPLAPVIEVYFTREKREFEEIQLVPRGKDIKGLVVVAWQHYGVSLSDQPNIYHSIRLNRKNELHLYTGSGDEIKAFNVRDGA
ncbi:MAG: hypothetical protein GY950_34490, partial [bacterium]|nr:hypothetical protein [bacterium]